MTFWKNAYKTYCVSQRCSLNRLAVRGWFGRPKRRLWIWQEINGLFAPSKRDSLHKPPHFNRRPPINHYTVWTIHVWKQHFAKSQTQFMFIYALPWNLDWFGFVGSYHFPTLLLKETLCIIAIRSAGSIIKTWVLIFLKGFSTLIIKVNLDSKSIPVMKDRLFVATFLAAGFDM